MSGQPPGGAGVPAPRNTSNGAANVNMAMPPQQRPNDGQVGVGGVGGQNGNPSPQNLNSIVSDMPFLPTRRMLPRVLSSDENSMHVLFCPVLGLKGLPLSYPMAYLQPAKPSQALQVSGIVVGLFQCNKSRSVVHGSKAVFQRPLCGKSAGCR